MDINILLEAFYDLIDFLGLIDDWLIDSLSLILIDLLWTFDFQSSSTDFDLVICLKNIQFHTSSTALSDSLFPQ